MLVAITVYHGGIWNAHKYHINNLISYKSIKPHNCFTTAYSIERKMQRKKAKKTTILKEHKMRRYRPPQAVFSNCSKSIHSIKNSFRGFVEPSFPVVLKEKVRTYLENQGQNIFSRKTYNENYVRTAMILEVFHQLHR